MSREIKFRIWDENSKKWLDNYRVYQYGNIANNGEWTDREEVVVQQYTGLKDNNGKEIYEGDIVSYSVTAFGSTEDIRLVVEYDSFRGCYDAMMPPTKEPSIPMSFANALMDCRMVGNIFENPELLK